ncbi:MAG: LPS-assembly protein LptD [Rhizobiales bacterium]|nr:LPS-assembly protein LptD [Hyphomicrobiales bacterium]
MAALQRMFGWLIGGSPAGLIARVAIAIALALTAVPASAAETPNFKFAPGSKMLVEADQLVYDYDHNTVSAVGNVKIYYSGYTLEAERVTYNKPSRRLVASGNVKLTDPTGLATYAQQLDLTDDFSDGFVDSLRVETPDKTRFAAARAERSNGEVTTFDHGVYTACEPCKDHPEKPPLWQINAQKIVHNQKTKTVYFQNASFEFMGVPIAYVPYFSAADPSVKRKSGFLVPVWGYTQATGWSVTTPYFLALAPSYDLTLSPTYYTNQGVMGQVEWRHRLSNGQYTVKVAGISQNNPDDFVSGNYGLPADRSFRGGIRTTGEFSINSRWTFGWDGTLSTDRLFTRNYSVLNSDTAVTTSQVHLTGIGDTSYFDIRAMHFQVLTDEAAATAAYPDQYDQARQGDALPVVDYNRVLDDPVFGGQYTVSANFTNVTRSKTDNFFVDSNGDGIPDTYYHGVAGDFARYSAQVDWEKKIIGPFGQVFTPFAYLRGDAFSINPTDHSTPLTDQTTAFRGMPAAGIEWSLPVLATVGQSTHVFEPMAQIIVRPNETMAGQLPNEDAQSLVWDDSLLFAKDKFSGYDRLEGGTRLNAGIHYLGTFSNGMSIDGVFGQSYQLAGANPFASADLADTGKFSGLETDASDYVGRIALDTGLGPRIAAHGRFDEKTFDLNRAQIEATNVIGPLTASASYIYLRSDPNAGIDTESSAASAAASINFIENWRLFGTVSYDLTKNALASDSLGLAFDNSCLTLALAYSEVRDSYSDIPNSRQVTFRLMMRTLGETSGSASLGPSGGS